MKRAGLRTILFGLTHVLRTCWRVDPEFRRQQVLYLEQGRIQARAGVQAFSIAPGDFLFLPPGAAADLRCEGGAGASGFLIQGRATGSSSPPHAHVKGTT